MRRPEPTGEFDVLVIGGGIVGAGVARDAAMRGLRTLLVEQSDFASGTSSRSSRLLHGGLRYLAQGRIGVQAVKYDAAKVHYLGGADVTRTAVSVMKASGVASLDDAKRREVLMGSTGKSGQTYIIPVVLNHMLGTKFRPVIGYQGINLIHLAMERGEIHGSAETGGADLE